MEKNLDIKSWRDYVLSEFKKINTDYSNLAIDKFKRIEEENTKELHYLIFSVNEMENSNIAWFGDWLKYIKD
jgi:hypothetical protein